MDDTQEQTDEASVNWARLRKKAEAEYLRRHKGASPEAVAKWREKYDRKRTETPEATAHRIENEGRHRNAKAEWDRRNPNATPEQKMEWERGYGQKQLLKQEPAEQGSKEWANLHDIAKASWLGRNKEATSEQKEAWEGNYRVKQEKKRNSTQAERDVEARTRKRLRAHIHHQDKKAAKEEGERLFDYGQTEPGPSHHGLSAYDQPQPELSLLDDFMFSRDERGRGLVEPSEYSFSVFDLPQPHLHGKVDERRTRVQAERTATRQAGRDSRKAEKDNDYGFER